MSYFWKTFDDGRTIGTIGSEEGKIIFDEENTFGARVTLEGQGSVAPASITIGVYGLMFHTDFSDSVEEGKSKLEVFKKRIELLISHHLIEDGKRDDSWNKHNQELIDKLASEV